MERMAFNRWIPSLKSVALGVSACLILVTAFQWSLVDLLTEFIMVPFQGIVWLIFVVVAAWSLLHFTLHAKISRSWIPAITCAVTLGVVTLVPFTSLWIRVNFASRKAERERIVHEVSEGTLTPNRVFPNGVGMISLPSQIPNVSAGGNEIETAKRDGRTYVFFYTYRGILSNYAGFLYVPIGGDPSAFENEDPLPIFTKYDEHWFFVSHSSQAL